MKADFYGALPFILRIFLISDNGKLHSKIFFTQCTQKVFEAFKSKVIIFTKTRSRQKGKCHPHNIKLLCKRLLLTFWEIRDKLFFRKSFFAALRKEFYLVFLHNIKEV